MVVRHTIGKRKREAMRKSNHDISPPSSLIYLLTRERDIRGTYTMKFIIVPLFSTAQGITDCVIKDSVGKLDEIVIESKG